MRYATVWIYIAILAWSPFPLGGAVSWAASLQQILIAGCGVLWGLASLGSGNETWTNIRFVRIPLVLAIAVLAWAWIQTLPIVPASWAHPLWAMTSDILGRPTTPVISLNPWHTKAQILSLLSTVLACWLAFAMAQQAKIAAILLNGIITIGALYALYGFALILLGTGQEEIFYAVPRQRGLIAGPFMLHNSYATYCGLAAVAAITKLFGVGSQSVVSTRGPRQLGLTLIQFATGRGAFLLVAALLCLAGVVASASRAGFAATLCSLLVLTLSALLVRHRNGGHRWMGTAAVVATLPLLFLVLFSGETLNDRISLLLDSGTTDTVRLTLWAAAKHMITDAPWLGLGLGTFQDAYPLYATQVLPFVMDKAHCDYLEFAAGIGIPAAVAWWLAIAWLVMLCLRGVRNRHRDRLYPLIAIAATTLVAIHSTVDFSLQLPAVAILYATLLGLGAAQAFPRTPYANSTGIRVNV